MLKKKKIISIILIMTLLAYSILSIVLNSNTYAVSRNRTTSLSGLADSYPGFATAINQLKQEHPNWTFTILYTGLDWNTVIYNETSALHGRSLVQNKSAGWTCPTCGTTPYDNGTWYCASPQAVGYYMDARNWLRESYIFSFETLSYDRTTQTLDGVQKILAGSFLDRSSITYYDTNGNQHTINKSYAQIIMEAAADSGVSPYHLASRIRQEQAEGSGLISGRFTYTDSNGNTAYDLRGYYNYFNIGATGSGSTRIIINGLTRAKSEGWTTPELAIKGGARFLATDYIANYQDSLYLQKYQVDSAGGLYSHQYMQNISAPFSEGYNTYTAYKSLGMLNYSFNFIIPVFENMPGMASPLPNAVGMEPVTENVKVTTSYSALKVRASASNSSTLIGSLDKGTIVLRIEKAVSMSSDGRYWDKIVYNNGSSLLFGYAARTDTDGSQYLTKVNDVVTTNEKAYTTTDVNLRNGPGTEYTTVKTTIANNTEVTVIDKINFIVNEHYWYRVKLSNGTQGYMASTYLTTNSTSTNNYKISESFILVTPSTRLANIGGATTSSQTFGTGAQITLEGTTYTLVMLADANGDGKINSADLLKLVKHLKGTSILDGAYLKAADCNNDSTVNSADLLKIVKYLKQTGNISL